MQLDLLKLLVRHFPVVAVHKVVAALLQAADYAPSTLVGVEEKCESLPYRRDVGRLNL
jgi:hypothetical protein